jgi:hypothetical protein
MNKNAYGCPFRLFSPAQQIQTLRSSMTSPILPSPPSDAAALALGRAILTVFVQDRLRSGEPGGEAFAEEVMQWMIARVDDMEVEEWTHGARCLLALLRHENADACPSMDEDICTAVAGRVVGQYPHPDEQRWRYVADIERLVWLSLSGRLPKS